MWRIFNAENSILINGSGDWYTVHKRAFSILNEPFLGVRGTVLKDLLVYADPDPAY